MSFFLISLLNSCVGTSFENPDLIDEYDLSLLTLRLESNDETSTLFANSSTRAEYHQASDTEKYIDKADLFIAIYDDTGKLMKVIFDSAGFSPSSADDTEGIDISKIPLSLSREEIRKPVTFAVIANLKDYIDGPVEFSTLSALKNTRYSLYRGEADEISVSSPLPMYKEQRFEPDDIVKSALFSESNSLTIKLERIVAKIRVTDMLPEENEWKITDVFLSSYPLEGYISPRLSEDNYVPDSESEPISSVGLHFQYTYDENESVFYAYIPEFYLKILSDEDYPSLSFTLQNLDGEETEASIWLAPGGVKPGNSDSDSPEETVTSAIPVWNSLLANHCYEFKVTGFTPSDPPEVDLTDEFYIVFIENETGKYSTNEFSQGAFINFSYTPLGSNSFTPLIERNQAMGTDVLNGYPYEEIYPPTELRYFILDKNLLQINNSNFSDLNYQIAHSDRPFELQTPLWGSLNLDYEKKDTRWIKDREATFFWMNTPPLYDMRAWTSDPSSLRIYWRGITRYVEVDYDKIDLSEIKDDLTRNYHYIDVPVSISFLSNRSLYYEINCENDIYMEGEITKYDIFIPGPNHPEEHNRGLFVFYAN